ncbi:hypothetical protein [Mangrovicoccus ximenensis]|uniref:hypothetical protein n=1 Tax=Mangrovicoccus ximenensis TaxID=1911570 RepID=UPI000D35A68B|nr:hypothetical protein [Mangrovicoccus ximenensis]
MLPDLRDEPGGTSFAGTFDASASALNVTLRGGGQDMIFGGAGDDPFHSEGGNDLIDAGSRDSTVFPDGVPGSDTAAGSDGHDVLSLSGSGAGTGGFDILFCGDGAGTAPNERTGQSAGVTGFEGIAGSANADVIGSGATTSGVTVRSGAGRGTITGGPGGDVLGGRSGGDRITGGAEADIFVVSPQTAATR